MPFTKPPRKASVLVCWLTMCLAGTSGLAQQNTATFDNKSGEPALVKLVGPTYRQVEVPTGAKRSVSASEGRYHIKVRYGIPGKYRYARGREFTITQTPTTRASITITLHKVVGGNYDSTVICAAEFGAVVPQPEVRKENELLVKYNGMAKPERQKFDSSIAFWDGSHMLVLVFRNFEAPKTKYDADPPVGRASLVVILRKPTGLASNGRALGFDEVSKGTYEPGILRWGAFRPPGGLFIFNKSGNDFGIGVFWKLNSTGRSSLAMWQNFRSMNFAQMQSFMEKLGTVRLTKVGRKPGSHITGQIALGDAEKGNVATGDFGIPVVEKPKDFK